MLHFSRRADRLGARVAVLRGGSVQAPSQRWRSAAASAVGDRPRPRAAARRRATDGLHAAQRAGQEDLLGAPQRRLAGAAPRRPRIRSSAASSITPSAATAGQDAPSSGGVRSAPSRDREDVGPRGLEHAPVLADQERDGPGAPAALRLGPGRPGRPTCARRSPRSTTIVVSSRGELAAGEDDGGVEGGDDDEAVEAAVGPAARRSAASDPASRRGPGSRTSCADLAAAPRRRGRGRWRRAGRGGRRVRSGGLRRSGSSRSRPRRSSGRGRWVALAGCGMVSAMIGRIRRYARANGMRAAAGAGRRERLRRGIFSEHRMTVLLKVLDSIAEPREDPGLRVENSRPGHLAGLSELNRKRGRRRRRPALPPPTSSAACAASSACSTARSSATTGGWRASGRGPSATSTGSARRCRCEPGDVYGSDFYVLPEHRAGGTANEFLFRVETALRGAGFAPDLGLCRQRQPRGALALQLARLSSR